MAQVVLKPRKLSRPFYGRHPWVLDSAIDRVEGNPADGDAVDLLSDRGKFIARGIFNSRSRIRVRLYTWNAGRGAGRGFWRARLEAALRLARAVGLRRPAGAARLVFSEGDGLSGLIVDRYGRFLVDAGDRLAMAVRLPEIVPMLVELARPQGIVLRTERGIVRGRRMELRDRLHTGGNARRANRRSRARARLRGRSGRGAEDGLYLDQRENRRAAAGYFRGRRVLDMFCYTGGFSLARGRGGAREVLGVDTSPQAVAQAEANARRNGLGTSASRAATPSRRCTPWRSAGERFDGVVLDPPNSPAAAARWTRPCGPIIGSIGWRSNCSRPAASW